jgi:aminoglycoside 3-N-acetyltransferase I
MEIKQLTSADLSTFKSLIELFNTVFEEEQPSLASDVHLLKLLDSKNFFALAAVAEDKVLGGLTAYELPMIYSDSSEIILYDMAVSPEHQRMGIGKKLMQGLKDYCVTNEIKTFFIMAHEEDGHAIEFYHATGGKSEKVVNFLYNVDEN